MGNVIKEKVCGKFYRILLASLLILVGICFWQGLFTSMGNRLSTNIVRRYCCWVSLF